MAKCAVTSLRRPAAASFEQPAGRPKAGRRDFNTKRAQNRGVDASCGCVRGVFSRGQITPYYGSLQDKQSDKCTKTWSCGLLRPINIKGKYVHAFVPFCWFEVWPDLGSKFGLLGLDLGVTRAGPQSLAADLGKKAACAPPHCRVPCA